MIEVDEKGKAALIEVEDNETNKYYAWHKTAPIGTVIQVTYPFNSKIVYVKITGQLASQGNDDILIKISKAGAEKLGAIDKEFDVNLLYGINKK